MKIIKIAALTLLLSSPLAHAMNNDIKGATGATCDMGTPLLFLGFTVLIAHPGIEIFKDKLNETANNIRKLNAMPDLPRYQDARQEKIKSIRETGLSAIVVGGATCLVSLSSLYLVYQCYTEN